ncbi:MAG: hypothetical protein RR239_04620 [Oscillospiraceae bacterium]
MFKYIVAFIIIGIAIVLFLLSASSYKKYKVQDEESAARKSLKTKYTFELVGGIFCLVICEAMILIINSRM